MSGATKQLAPEPRNRRIDTRFTIAELALVEKVAAWRGLRAVGVRARCGSCRGEAGGGPWPR